MDRIKKLLILLLLLLPLIVKADTCDTSKVTIESISIENSLGTVVEKGDTEIDNTNINFDLVMSNPGDSITYKIIIKNDSDEDVKIDKNIIKSSDYLKYSFYEKEDSVLIKAKTTKTIYFKIEYLNEVPEQLMNSGTYEDNQEISLSLLEEEFVNPNTGIAYFLIILVVFLLGVSMLITQHNKRIATASILCLLLIPILVSGVCKYNITVKSHISITKIAEFDSSSIVYNKMNTLSGNGQAIKSFKRSNTLPNEIKELVDTELSEISNITISDEDLNQYFEDFKNNTWIFNDFSIKEIDGVTNYCEKWEEEDFCYTKEEMINYSDYYFAFIVVEEDQTKYLVYNKIRDELEIIEDEEVVKQLLKENLIEQQIPSLSNHIFSSSKSDFLIYGWYDESEQVIYYYCERENVFLNKDSSGLFYNYTALESVPGIESLNTSRVTNMSSLFENCSSLTSLNLRKWDTSKVKNMSNMFKNDVNLELLDISSFHTGNVTDMSYMFYECPKVTSLDFRNFDTSNVTRMSYMFSGDVGLTSLDLNSFHTGNVTAMDWMFEDCENLTEIKMDNFDTSNVKTMAMMFSGCTSMPGYDLRHFNTSNCTNMRYMFCNNYAATYLDVSSFDTSNVTDMGWMFSGLTSIESLDLSNFDTTNVTTMQSMFSLDSNLTDLDISSFRTPSLKNMKRTFGTLSKLESLDLSAWDTSNVTDMSFLFEKDYKLSSLDISSFNTSKVKTMFSMFHENKSITSLDLRHFNTSKVTTMYCMFYGMENLVTLDLSSFDTSKVTSISNMFRYDSNLEHIYVSDGWTTAMVTESTANYGGGASVFTNCYKLPNYAAGQNDKSKAHYGEGGYLTYKAN